MQEVSSDPPPPVSRYPYTAVPLRNVVPVFSSPRIKIFRYVDEICNTAVVISYTSVQVYIRHDYTQDE